MRGLAPHSPDFVHGNENRRARQIVGRFEADADRGGIRPHTLSAMRLLFWQLTNRSLARPLVAVAVVLVEIGMSLQENLREICPLTTGDFGVRAARDLAGRPFWAAPRTHW